MPKQIWKIDKFHGGLNSNADPRDLGEGELAEAQDVMVDELGKIRTMGGIAAHESDDGSPSVAAFDINPGYGLVQFSHDRVNGHLGEHLLNVNDFNNKWTIAGDFLAEAITEEEYITLAPTNNRTFDATVGNWSAHGDTTLTWGAAFGRTGATSPSDGGLQISPDDADTHDDGAKLDKSAFATVSGDTYKITVDIKGGHASGLAGFKIELGGVPTEAFSVTTAWATYTKYIKVGSEDDLKIFNTNNNEVDWYIDNVSIQQVTGTTYKHSTGTGSLIQTAANRSEKGIANTTYALTYTVSRFAESITTFRITGSGSQFASANTDLVQTNGTHTTTFTSHATDADQPFTIYVASGSSGTLHLSNLSLRIYESAETGDDYLALVDNQSTISVTNATYNDETEIDHDDRTDIRPGYLVSGTNIPSDAFVVSVTDNGTFQINEATTGGSTAGTLTLTKPPGLYIYSRNNNTWSTSPVVQLGTGGSGIKSTFYQTDGALRISDSNFLNDSTWYGYIKRTLWQATGRGVPINEWVSIGQRLRPPTTSYYDKSYTFVEGETGESTTLPEIEFGGYGDDAVSGGSQMLRTAVETAFAGSGSGAVKRCSVSVTIFGVPSDQQPWKLYNGYIVTITAGPWNTVSGFSPNAQSISWTVSEWDDNSSGVERSTDLFFDPVFTNPTSAWTVGGDDSNDYWRVEVVMADHPNQNFRFTTVQLNQSTMYEGSATDTPDLHDGGDLANGYITGGNVVMLMDWGVVGTTGGIGWIPADNAGSWNIGATFIYDGKQESRMTKLIDSDDITTTTLDIATAGGGDPTTTTRPTVLIAFADPRHNGLGRSDGSSFNKRITGCNIYMQDVYVGSGGKISPWFLQYSMDFIEGKLIVESTQAEHDAEYHPSINFQSYYYFNLPRNHTESPAKITTYEINSGYRADTTTWVDSYKTAVVSNRMAYIGNVKISDERETRVYGDRMMKSAVNQFDKFTSIRVVDASIEDGDEIVKLEEYADRILQFKKLKMHLINVSQDIEFLEETFLHKGISHPASACKTDFGIAWANANGCYLYDGQKVHNLLEKKGRQIIKESEWDKFLRSNKTLTGTRLTPMVGYLPKKRQIVVYDDITTGGDPAEGPSMYLYDMVTQSWVKGANDTSNRIIDTIKSNFTNDWNGDLVYTVSTDGIYKSSDASVITDTFSFKTNDIDFGQPSQRKKVYRVRISYKGDADTLTTKFSVDGDTDTLYQFINPDSGSGDDTPLADKTDLTKWHHAELKPTTSSQANNIYSFQLHMTGTVDSDFEINDISIVFRPKSVK